MKKLIFSSAIAALAIATSATGANTRHRLASFVSNEVADSGKCTVEVVVPGAAEVKIDGESASLQHLAGRSPEWRRFECTSPMPDKPEAFRMETINGRGHQDLVYGPRHNGGKAKVYIHDSKSGEGSYTFDIIWGPSTQ